MPQRVLAALDELAGLRLDGEADDVEMRIALGIGLLRGVEDELFADAPFSGPKTKATGWRRSSTLRALGDRSRSASADSDSVFAGGRMLLK